MLLRALQAAEMERVKAHCCLDGYVSIEMYTSVWKVDMDAGTSPRSVETEM